MDRRLIDYLPPVLRDVLEYQSINAANEPEIRAAWGALSRLMDNQFLDSADPAALSVWEREIGIRPKDTDSLDARRFRIKSAWNLDWSYTIAWLRQWLAAIADGQPYSAELTDYTLHISTQWTREGQVESIKELLALGAIPANVRMVSENSVISSPASSLFAAPAVRLSEIIELSDNLNDYYAIGSAIETPPTIRLSDLIELSDSLNDAYTLSAPVFAPPVQSVCDTIQLHD